MNYFLFQAQKQKVSARKEMMQQLKKVIYCT